MKIGPNIYVSLVITSVVGFICFVYLFKQSSSMKKQNSFFIFVRNSSYYNKTVAGINGHNQTNNKTVEGINGHNQTNNKTVEEMNDRNHANNYSDLLKDFEKHDKWSLSTFLKKRKGENNHTRLASRKKICIVNIDTRPLERFSIVKDFDKMSFHSVAAYNNLFYAIQHGYDYQRITVPPIPGYHNTWVKIAHLYDIIHKYDIVVFLDADAYVRQPNISLEFLMARYKFTVNSSFLMATDPKGKRNADSKGRAALNTGFIIVQNNNLTKNILRRLALCAETISGCEIWKREWSYEQRAFTEYLRDQMKLGSELIIAPCKELNGFEGSSSGCRGIFITHVWTAKHTIRERLKRLMMTNLMAILEEVMWGENHASVASTSDVRKLGSQSDILYRANRSSIK